MKKLLIGILGVLLYAGATVAQEQSSCRVASMPPVVIKTVPAAGDTAVDPGLRQISITFSKEMAEGFSWVQTPDAAFPELTADPVFTADKRTCVASVRLMPGTTYVMWFNSGQYQNFKDTSGNAAVPYLLVFETGK